MLSPGLTFAIVWIDIAERPDLAVLTEQDTLADGYSLVTFFYANPGKYNMRLGMRIEMKQPVRFVLPLVFKVSEYVEPLTTISHEGNLWIVPGPPQKHLTGIRAITATEFIDAVVSHAGQGLFITLQEHLVMELRERLAEWKQRT